MLLTVLAGPVPCEISWLLSATAQPASCFCRTVLGRLTQPGTGKYRKKYYLVLKKVIDI